MKKTIAITLLIASVWLFKGCNDGKFRILVFSKTAGFRHKSIENGKAMFLKIASENGYKVDTSENASIFTDENLKKYNAIVFLSTTGDILNGNQQVALERYIQSGGGFVGIHAATDTEYDWPWFCQMVGGNFESHPHIQKATINVLDKSHPSTEHLNNQWIREDEWYNFKNLNPNVKVLATIDEKSYSGGKLGDYHPMVWYHEYDGGRAFYTEFGHTEASYEDPDFIKHIIGGIKYAVGEGKNLDYAKARSQYRPDQSRFQKNVIKEGLNEPMALAVSPRGKVFYCERRGGVFLYDPTKGGTKKVADVYVDDFAGHGLMGMCLDPNFDYNQYVYLFYLNKEEQYKLSRFTFKNEELDLSTEQNIISFHFDKEPGAHNGGTILFDKHGNLVISIGDNTPPWQANGYPPYDQREGREIYDAQRTSSNTRDLRGKILRIKPNYGKPGYTIPDGNLFPKNSKDGLPEIYAMGCRNPWRMSYDAKNDIIYWGEVGPDARADSSIGPKGYDEINQAKKPGFYGWPYFVADNKPYKMVDLVNPTPGALADEKNPTNFSKNNTGLKNIPFAPQKAFVYYPYDQSFEFPEVGMGGRTACAGPVYEVLKHKNSDVKFPSYYDGKLFIYEWMRDWVKVVTTDEQGNYISTEPVFDGLKFDHPTHMAFAPDGSLYVLEYGLIWYSQNENARLSRITFHQGNRPPVAKVTPISDTIGAVPLKVTLAATKSFDKDGDSLTYEWSNGDFLEAKGKEVTFTYTSPGVYWAKLVAKDKNGAVSQVFQKIIAGNTYPTVRLNFNSGNRTFYWEDTELSYTTQVSDKEDKFIDQKRLKVVMNYLNIGKDIYPLTTPEHTAAPTERSITENKLIANSDCKACHAFNKKSVGPAFTEIAKRYNGEQGATDMLAKKIINGGAGNWGEHAMSAHPQLSLATAKEMVNYILGLAMEDSKNTKLMPMNGVVPSSEFEGKKGTFYITATYTDGGKDGKGTLSAFDKVCLINNQLEAIDNDSTIGSIAITSSVEGKQNFYQGAFADKSWIKFKNLDLTGIDGITLRTNSKEARGKIEIRIGSANGKTIASIPIKPAGEWEKWDVATAPILPTNGYQNVYVIFLNDRKGDKHEMINVDWIRFEKSKGKLAMK